MIRRFIMFTVLSLACVGVQAQSANQKSAEAAATEIMNMLGNREFQKVYDAKTSAIFKKFVNEGQFLANITMGRAGLGKLSGSRIVDVQLSNYDPTTQYKGDIFSVNFDNRYDGNRRFFERIVVVKDNDGVFRMSGFWGVPAQ